MERKLKEHQCHECKAIVPIYRGTSREEAKVCPECGAYGKGFMGIFVRR